MSGASILVLEDDPVFQATLAEALAAAGFCPTLAGTVAEAEALLQGGSTRFDMLVLDVGLPDGDGRDLCARLRTSGLHTPIIMLTGSDADDDIVRGLEAGANDYVAKPCSAAVLVARLRTQMRLHEGSVDAVYDLGPWRFHPTQRLVQNAEGVRVRLTVREVDVLCYLQRNGGVASKQALLAAVWHYHSSVTTHTLESHIYRLRQKIEADPYTPSVLLTVLGGYRLAGCETAPVRDPLHLLYIRGL